LTAVPSRGNVVVLTSPPQTVGKCKTFDELKMYWAENYNVKVDDSIAKLHFGSVQAAMNGVEAVLKEFPPAMRFLKEFSVLPKGLMTTSRGRGIINFDPESFSDERKLLVTLASGVKSGIYVKNMTVAGVGMHEAGHIVEDWLRGKYIENSNVSLRILPRKFIREASRRARQIFPNKTIFELVDEISECATKNLSECFADAIVDYMINGQNAARLSQCIWQRLKEELS